MPQPSNEPTSTPQDPPDLFDEPRDHSNQWDISMLWQEDKPERVDPNAGREAE